ncbi:beta-ketoacyl [acyl carrier protein] synthase domain-containing protein, partial [Streptomyces violaceorubidus]
MAVVGLSCRLPKAAGPAAFWRLLRGAGSAVGPVPAARQTSWTVSDGEPPTPAGADSPHGGFLEDVDMFDPGFFGISPREAAAMDPRQRLALELGWEALEDAGIVPAAIAGDQAGVFVGAMGDDYAALSFAQEMSHIGHHTATGVQRGMIANRLSYVLGLRGPSLTVDTGQSSSLVAVHLAGESLRRGECSLAIVGGVHLALAPHSAVAAARLGALSPDGRCYTFDARANGYARGEGGAFVVLKPLSRALADGDRVYCVIRGTAVNNDGGGDGLTSPSRAGQEAVLAAACRRAGIAPRDVCYVELHGTGTPVGDPVEASALGTVFGAGRDPARPLLVGSVKTNVGHLEGAAGITGLVKTALALRHRLLPASLNFERPNPRIPLDSLRLRVVTASQPWPDTAHDEAGDGPRDLLAGVSSFGLGGTNCHLVVGGGAGGPPPPGPPPPPPPPPRRRGAGGAGRR